MLKPKRGNIKQHTMYSVNVFIEMNTRNTYLNNLITKTNQTQTITTKLQKLMTADRYVIKSNSPMRMRKIRS